MADTTPIPYVTTWSEEKPLPTQVIAYGSAGIGYTDETILDRDEHHVLWTRIPSRPGHGTPILGRVHSLRQRRAMRRLLCQICGQPAHRTEQGLLWLLLDHRDDWPDWPDNMANTHPPVCLPCARKAIRACPALRRGYVAVRARHCPLTGVYGLRYQPTATYPTPTEGAVVGYHDPAIRWTRAVQQVRTLQNCTIVALDQDERPGQRPVPIP
jgi:hypothetical protein